MFGVIMLHDRGLREIILVLTSAVIPLRHATLCEDDATLFATQYRL